MFFFTLTIYHRGVGFRQVELLDDRGGEIAACFFKESAEKFYPLLEVNQVYTWSNGRLKVANKQYSSCNSDYEISFGSDADIRLCDEDSSIKTVNFNFRKLDSVEQVIEYELGSLGFSALFCCGSSGHFRAMLRFCGLTFWSPIVVFPNRPRPTPQLMLLAS